MLKTAMIALGALALSAGALTADAAPRDDALRAHLRKMLGPAAEPDTTQVITAWRDLNGDGRAEALAYVTGPGRCGSGGCNLYVFEPTGGGFRSRGQLSITRPPIGVLPTRTQGWRHLTVQVGGGGIVGGYTADVPFRGTAYVGNPTVPPSRRLPSGVKATILLTGDETPERLFDTAKPMRNAHPAP